MPSASAPATLAANGTFSVISVSTTSPRPSARIQIWDNTSVPDGLDTSADVSMGSVTLEWGSNSVTGSFSASGTIATAPALQLSGTFEAPFCDALSP